MGPSLRWGDEEARSRGSARNALPSPLGGSDSNSTASLHGSRAERLPGPLAAELSCVRLVISLP